MHLVLSFQVSMHGRVSCGDALPAFKVSLVAAIVQSSPVRAELAICLPLQGCGLELDLGLELELELQLRVQECILLLQIDSLRICRGAPSVLYRAYCRSS